VSPAAAVSPWPARVSASSPAASVPPRVVAAVPCVVCGKAGRLYRLRGYTAAGHLEAETAGLCSHHRVSRMESEVLV